MNDKLNDRLNEFYPFWGLGGPRRQTLGARYWPGFTRLSRALVRRFELKDESLLILKENGIDEAKIDQPLVFLLHGLCGDSESGYMKRVVAAIERRLNAGAIRFNLRNAGDGFGLAKRSYHSGLTGDIAEVLSFYRKLYPERPFYLVGFSLGANLVLKYLGEQSGPAVRAAVAISPPFDLAASAEKLKRRENRLFEAYFLKELSRLVDQLRKIRPLDAWPVTGNMKHLEDFDEQFTAPLHGFVSADDYYRKNECGPYLSKIKTPTFILFSLDDPVVECATYASFNPSEACHLKATTRGGHVGFLGQPHRPGGARWFEDQIIGFLSREGIRGFG